MQSQQQNREKLFNGKRVATDTSGKGSEAMGFIVETKPHIVCQVLDFEYSYGLEYSGVDYRGRHFHGRNRMLHSQLLAFQARRCAIVNSNGYSPNSALLRDAAYATGSPLLVRELTGSETMPSLMMILTGIVSSGMWASLGQIENLKAGTLAAFASCILDVQRAAVRRYGTIHLGGEKVKVCRRWHLSFTTCKSDENTVKLFRSEMRVIEMRLVSKDYVLELLLLMAGFKDSAAPLAKTCLQTLRMADVAIRPVNPNCPQLCTLQFARLVAKRAGRFVGQCASLGHAQLLLSTLESHFFPRKRGYDFMQWFCRALIARCLMSSQAQAWKKLYNCRLKLNA